MIVVTGSGGPLGWAVKNILGEKGLYPRSNNCDLTNMESLTEWLTLSTDPAMISGIIHLAAYSGGAHLSKMKPADMFRDNMVMAINVLEAARKFKVKRVILTLSNACYPENFHNPSEANLHSGPASGIDYSYAYAKRMMEPLMRAYNDQYSMEISCVLVNGIIGPNMNFRNNESILPAALIRRFYEEKINGGENFTVWGDGTPIREYSYSEDLAKATLWCFENQPINSLLNIGSTEKISVKKCALAIAKSLDIPIDKLYFDVSKIGGRQIQVTDNSQFITLSNFKYSTFDNSISKTVRWFTDQMNSKSEIKL